MFSRYWRESKLLFFLIASWRSYRLHGGHVDGCLCERRGGGMESCFATERIAECAQDVAGLEK